MQRTLRVTAFAISLAVTMVCLTVLASMGQEKVTLVIGNRTDSEEMLRRSKISEEIFKKKYPYIELKPMIYQRCTAASTKLMMQIASGTEPDMVAMGCIEPLEFYLNGYLLSLNQLFAEDKDCQSWVFASDLALPEFTYDGNLVALPAGVYVYAKYVNKTMFDKEGIPVPKWGWTWDDMLSISRKLTRDTNGDGAIDQYGYEFMYTHHDFFSELVREKGTTMFTFDERGWVSGANFEDPRVLEALQWWADLIAKYQVCPLPEAKGYTALGFRFGNVGISTGGTWRISGYREEIGDKFEWTPVPNPALKKGQDPLHLALQRPLGLILSTTKHPKEAWLYLKHFASPELYNQLIKKGKCLGLTLPPFDPSMSAVAKETADIWTSLTPPGKEAMSLFLDILRGGYIYTGVDNIVPYGYERFLDILVQTWPTVLTGKKTVEEAFKPLNAELTAALRGE